MKYPQTLGQRLTLVWLSALSVLNFTLYAIARHWWSLLAGLLIAALTVATWKMQRDTQRLRYGNHLLRTKGLDAYDQWRRQA